MKSLLLLALLSFNATAVDYEIFVKHMVISQGLFAGTDKEIDFKHDGVSLGGSVTHSSGVGLEVFIATATEAANGIYQKDKFYTNRIKIITNTSLTYRYELSDNWHVKAKVGYTDYKTEWKVNDVNPTWFEGADSGLSYGVEVSYAFNDWLKMAGGYDNLYRKHKKGHGEEKTKALHFGFIAYF